MGEIPFSLNFRSYHSGLTIADYVPIEGVSSNLAGRSIETDDAGK